MPLSYARRIKQWLDLKAIEYKKSLTKKLKAPKESNSSGTKTNPNNPDDKSEHNRICDGISSTTQEANTKNHQEQSKQRMKSTIGPRLWRFWRRRRLWRLMAGIERANWAEKTTVIVTIGILAVGGLQAYIYWQQTQVMQSGLSQNERTLMLNQGQLVVANRNAKVAEQAVSDAHNNFIIEERPYIVVVADKDHIMSFLKPPAVNSSSMVNVVVKNIGKTPAFGYIWVGNILKFHPLSKTLVGKELESIKFLKSSFKNAAKGEAISRETATKYGVKVDLAPEASTLITAKSATPQDLLTAEEKELLYAGDDVRLYNMGLISYYDSFGNRYETQYCYFFFGSYPGFWHVCESNNEIR
jgi:hypothetical protein